MEDLGWYLFMIAAAALFGVVTTGHAAWLYHLPRPWPRRAYVSLGAFNGFIGSILMYAFGIDSRRIPYQEPGIWAVLVIGTFVVALLYFLRRGD